MTTFYDPRQSVPGVDSYSPSAGKPQAFMEVHACDPVKGFDPVTRDDLLLVHAPEYVKGVFDGTRLNGFENRDPRVAAACLYTVGSLLAAARAAIRFPLIPMCSPTSGFHHAGYAEGGGFCTFNGLMVVAAKLIQENPATRVAILDCDVHYGDGTDDILRKKPELAPQVLHLSAGSQVNRNGDGNVFILWLAEAVKQINAWKPTVVLYQAGADMHIDDPLGGILDNRQMQERDGFVFDNVVAPIAWNFAGGYQTPLQRVLDLHIRTHQRAARSVRTRQERFATAYPEGWQDWR